MANIADNTFAIVSLYTNIEFRLHTLKFRRDIEIMGNSHDLRSEGFPGMGYFTPGHVGGWGMDRFGASFRRRRRSRKVGNLTE